MLNSLRSDTESLANRVDDLGNLMTGFSIEVTPRTAANIPSFREILPGGTRVYIAHIPGTQIDSMVSTARRLREEGFLVMPHFPARCINNRGELTDWLQRYRNEADVDEALLVAGGLAQPNGDFSSSIELLQTDLFETNGFRRLHVAGHPEGNLDIDTDGTTRRADQAMRWKQAYCDRGTTEMAIVTQFLFEARPAIEWSKRLRDLGVRMPIHLGVTGPTRLQTLIKFAITCGVGGSIKVLKKRARDISKLMLPYEPTDLLTELAVYRAGDAQGLIERVHVFPLGGITASARWAASMECPGPATSAV